MSDLSSCSDDDGSTSGSHFSYDSASEIEEIEGEEMAAQYANTQQGLMQVSKTA